MWWEFYVTLYSHKTVIPIFVCFNKSLFFCAKKDHYSKHKHMEYGVYTRYKSGSKMSWIVTNYALMEKENYGISMIRYIWMHKPTNTMKT
jgi:hypothetical protein